MILIWIHLLAAMLWIGGMLFFAMVLVPSLRALPPPQKTELISQIGQRFRKIGWIALGILLVTGFLRLYHLGLPVSMRGWLGAKLAMVILMVSLTLLHDLVLGPRSIEISRANPAPHPLRGAVRWIARLNLVVGILIVLAAVYVARGY